MIRRAFTAPERQSIEGEAELEAKEEENEEAGLECGDILQGVE